MIEQRSFTQHQVDNYYGATSPPEEVSSVVDEGEEGVATFWCPDERLARGKGVFSHFHTDNRSVRLDGEGSHGAET